MPAFLIRISILFYSEDLRKSLFIYMTDIVIIVACIGDIYACVSRLSLGIIHIKFVLVEIYFENFFLPVGGRIGGIHADNPE